MSAMERELKLALESAEDHRRLCEVLPGFFEERVQENSYWDLPDGSLAGAGIMLRLRIEGPRARVTVKRAARRHEGFFEAPEDEESVTIDVAREVNAGARPFTALGGEVLGRLREELGSLEALARWGHMTNRRRRYRLPGDLVAEVDLTWFPGDVVEYEVELESDDVERARQRIVSYLERGDIRYRPQTRTKSERLRELLGRNDS